MSTRASRPLALTATALAIAALALAPATAGAAPSDDGPDGTAVGLGPVAHSFSPAPGNQAAFAYGAGIDRIVDGRRVPEIWLSYSAAPDSATAEVNNGILVSHDAGQSFTDRRSLPQMWTGAMTQLDDGSMMSLDFIPQVSGSTFSVRARLSTNAGKTWTVRDGKITLPRGYAFDTAGFNRGLRMQKGLFQPPDGTLLAPAYGRFAGEPAWCSFLLQSTDQGATWTLRGRMSTPTSPDGTSEATMSRSSDGRLIAVLRGAPEKTGLLQTESSDDGRTWSKPQKIDVPGAHTTGAVEPSLVLQPNGILVLAYGRPDNHIMISPSGTGDDWQDEQVILANAPADGPADHGSSGNSSLVNVDASRTVIFGDTCAPWGCQEYDEKYTIFSRSIDAVGPGTGKLDLRQMVLDGRASITGTFAKTPKKVPQLRPEGAVDGSSSPLAAAPLKSSRKAPGQMTIELDQVYSLDRIGLMLEAGVPSDAQVQLSTDGTTWTAPVITATDRTDHSMRYTDFAPQDAKFVRISAPAGGSLGAVGEIELYRADADTFENDPVGYAPRGWTGATGAEVIEAVPSNGTPRTAGFQSSRALRLLDMDPKAQSRITKPFDARGSVDLSFRSTGLNRQGGLAIELLGTTAAGESTAAYTFAIDPISKQIRAYDGKAWTVVGTMTASPAPGQWFSVRLRADATSATLTVDGQDFAMGAPRSAPTSLTGLSFASSGTAFTGSSYLIDDLSIP
ncbi:exo-alpha-sialidase [Brachybacterium huguangmaarense]